MHKGRVAIAPGGGRLPRGAARRSPLLAGAGPAAAATLPPGFQETVV